MRDDTRIALHIDTRDRMKRIAVLCLLAAIFWWKAATSSVAILICLGLMFEIWFECLRRKGPDEDEKITMKFAWHYQLHGTCGIVLYTLPALLLMLIPGPANIVCSMLWLSGMAIHISNSFVLVTSYFWPKNLVIFGMSILSVIVLSQTPPGPSDVADWFLAGGLMLVFLGGTIETHSQQEDTRKALDTAQAKAALRLQELEHIMRHDPLTGLLRRTAFDEAVEQMLSNPNRGIVGVMIIDLDGFKPINDTYGHAAGDHLLKIMGGRLRARESTIASRLGGDEFGLAVDNLDEADAVMDLAHTLRDELLKPLTWENRSLSVGASIGVNLSGDDAASVEGLCAGADQAMYHAKTGEGDGVVLYDRDLFQPRLNLLDRQFFLDGMASGGIVPFYQPKVSLSDRHIVGFEALARWPDPDSGKVRMPADFLSQIAELQLQGEFTSHMTRRVLTDICHLKAAGLNPGQVSINLPEIALATYSGLEEILWLLAEFPKATPHVTFEITEDVLIARAGGLIRDSIDRLSEEGARISLDDFGSGFASFQHLRQLTFDELKIDTSFVAGLGKEPVSEVIVDGFLSIARGLGVTSVAEGVETEAQARHLSSMGCDLAQGFLFGKAAPLSTAEQKLRDHRSMQSAAFQIAARSDG